MPGGDSSASWRAGTTCRSSPVAWRPTSKPSGPRLHHRALSNLIQPGHCLRIADDPTAAVAGSDLSRAAKGVDPSRTIRFVDELVALVPTSLVRPIVDNAVISIVIVAILLGMALRTAKS